MTMKHLCKAPPTENTSESSLSNGKEPTTMRAATLVPCDPEANDQNNENWQLAL